MTKHSRSSSLSLTRELYDILADGYLVVLVFIGDEGGLDQE